MRRKHLDQKERNDAIKVPKGGGLKSRGRFKGGEKKKQKGAKKKGL